MPRVMAPSFGVMAFRHGGRCYYKRTKPHRLSWGNEPVRAPTLALAILGAVLQHELKNWTLSDAQPLATSQDAL